MSSNIIRTNKYNKKTEMKYVQIFVGCIFFLKSILFSRLKNWKIPNGFPSYTYHTQAFMHLFVSETDYTQEKTLRHRIKKNKIKKIMENLILSAIFWTISFFFMLPLFYSLKNVLTCLSYVYYDVN